MPDEQNQQIVKSATDARAGVTGQNVRGVLMASLVGAILVMILIAAVSFK